MTSRKKKKSEPRKKEQGQAAPAAPKEDAEDWRERALRAQAEMINMRRRLDHDVEERTRMRTEALLAECITLADHLELALSALPESLAGDASARPFVQGVQAIQASLTQMLERFGVESIHPQEGQEFDSQHFEAIHVETREGLGKERMELLRRGYRLGRRILRPAQVKLLRPKENEKNEEPRPKPPGEEE
ncbi:MAG: nucleotide exchange factor GrpE [Planctomycetota bacterium]